LLTHSVLKRGFDLNYFVKSRFTKIFVPYIIWTTVYLYYLGVVEVNLDSNKNFIGYYLFGTGNYHLYIIISFLEFYFLFSVLVINIEININFILFYLFITYIYHLYFILTVHQFYVLFPVLQKIKKGLPLLLTYAFSTILTVFWQLNYEQFSIDIPVIGTFVMS